MNTEATPNFTPLPSTISGSATVRVMDQQIIPWALYDLSGAHAPDSLGTMQDYFRRFRELLGKSLEVSHTMLCRVPGAPSSGDETGCLKMVEAFQCGSPPERTFALIIHSARYAIECARKLGVKTDSAAFT